MNEHAHRARARLRDDQAVLRAAAEVVRNAPAAGWAGLDDPEVAERLAGVLDLLAERLERTPEQDRAVWVRIAGHLIGRPMDRPTVRRTRRR